MTPRLKAIMLIPVPLALLCIAFGALSLSITRHSLEELNRVENKLARIEGGLENQKHITAYAEGLDLDGLEAAHFLSAPSPTIAKARLQERLTTLARRAGLMISSARIIDSNDAHLTAVVHLDMSGNLNALTAFLQSIENGAPQLRTNTFSLTRRPSAGADQFSIAIAMEALIQIERPEL